MGSMQFSKTSKKTRNIADKTKATAPESAATEIAPSPRTTRSSKTKKTETTESAPVKHRHNTENGRTMAVGSASVILDPAGVVTPAAEATISAKPELPSEAGHEEIAKLAYTYWIARGYSHGSAEEDWLRAERELQRR
jgi:Protein of unknown function (DUF2934)